ncbi:glycosyltransferase [Telmatocola sphagniphila]|uniref:Glycosyltransferase n=1 Tax=Telmatocola sphagniphila TaxID=1123043 RepID=A0A8E6EUB3_9BACT|nr:glycosyltransferase [Telmatocola sphagniphila]QVL31042.1 glycosyltransferase [Telmatocola sphagniphila]
MRPNFVIRQMKDFSSPQRAVLKIKGLIRRFLIFYSDLRFGKMPLTFENPFHLPLINGVLRRARLSALSADPKQLNGTEATAARYILARYLEDVALRNRFPLGLAENDQGGLCEALCSEFQANATAVDNIRTAFARQLGARPLQAFDHYLDWHEKFPLSLTPAGSRRYMEFLLRNRVTVHLSIEEILWFHLQNAADPYKGIISTYLRMPLWQQKFPNGLSKAEFEEMLEWIDCHYKLGSPLWLSRVPDPKNFEQCQAERSGRTVVRKEKPLDLGANVLAHFRYASGLQEAALNTVRALEAVKLPHTLRDVPVAKSLDQPGREHLLGQEVFDFSLLHLAPIPNPVLHYPKAGLWQRPGVHRAGIWYWELEVIPEEWPAHARELNEIWAPTRFIHQAMSKVMPVPVVPMLPGVPVPVAPQLPRQNFGLDPNKFLFLFMFDMNSVMERKNPLGLIEAYRRAFGNSRSTQLAIKVSRGKSDPESYARLTAAAATVGGVLIDRVMTREECYGLMNCCDAYVSLHRSEGFGLTIAEAMLLGKPVVATAYSGNLDFNTPENSKLIPFDLIPITQASPVYPKGGYWAEPSISAAAEAMKWLYEDAAGRQAIARRGEADARKILSLEAYGHRIQSHLRELKELGYGTSRSQAA